METVENVAPMHALRQYLQSRSATRPMAQELRSAFGSVTYRTDQLHRHDYFEIYVLEKGQGLCVADAVYYQVKPQSVFIVPPGTMHFWENSDGMDGFIARIPLIEGHALLTRTEICPEVFQVDPGVHPHLLSLLRWIVADDPTDDTRRTPMSRMRWKLLFECLSGEAQKSLQNPDSSSQKDVSAAFMSTLERKYHLRWGVQDYAKALKVSRSSLLRATQAAYGCSPAELIQQRTLKEAERLLTTTDQTCAEISEALGYLSQAQFTRAFSGHFHEAPTVYRRNRMEDAGTASS
ncbi:helix-turn-helix domain-containing protein [Pacificoceanicola onchidii]|uniref:helix-turn-helix domain-containing protein n=1 Tax=Pacificoceanicola onchidii TaxID=2562685 RepID=UPI0010A5B54F|nr:AraC family transcriptional regulator [Pacificoceanicola onchidii]